QVVASILMLGTLIVLTAHRCLAFMGEESLWLDTIQKNPEARMAYVNYACYLMDTGRASQAERQFGRALTLGESADVRLNLGLLAEQRGDLAGAADQYRRAAALSPGWAQPHFLLG